MSRLIAIIMAAGHGTRMKSSLPKVLHPACGRPLLYYPVRAALLGGADEVVVVANPMNVDAIAAVLGQHIHGELFQMKVQEVPRGTGDAVRAGLQSIQLGDTDRVLILSGDTPLLVESDWLPLKSACERGAALAFSSFVAPDPTGYGRVLRDDEGKVTEIREHKDLTSDDQRAICEVNAGIYLANAAALTAALSQLRCENAQQEYYLTDIVSILSQSEKVVAVPSSAESCAGVNDRKQLNELAEVLYARVREHWTKAGVTIIGAPLIDDTVELALDVCVEQGVRLRGKTQIGEGTRLDVGCVVEDCQIGRGAVIKPYCVISESKVGDGVQLGPFAHLRPQSVLEDGCHIGNFVETKNTWVKKGAKANHLAYLGDAEIGEKSNLGAGTIICNYDGFQKQRTIIGAGVFVGSDSQIVAPVKIGDGAYVATATTVTKDVPAGALSIGRVRQSNKEGYAEPLKARLKAKAELSIAAKLKS